MFFQPKKYAASAAGRLTEKASVSSHVFAAAIFVVTLLIAANSAIAAQNSDQSPAMQTTGTQKSMEEQALLKMADTFQTEPTVLGKFTRSTLDALSEKYSAAVEADAKALADASTPESSTPSKVYTYCEAQKSALDMAIKAMPASITMAEIALACADALKQPNFAYEKHIDEIFKAYQKHFPGDRPWLARPVMSFDEVYSFLKLKDSRVQGMQFRASSQLMLEVYEVNSADPPEFSYSYYNLTPLILSQLDAQIEQTRSPLYRRQSFKATIKIWAKSDSVAQLWLARHIEAPKKRFDEYQRIASDWNSFAGTRANRLCFEQPGLACNDLRFDATLTQIEADPNNVQALLEMANFQRMSGSASGLADWSAAIKLLDKAGAIASSAFPKDSVRAQDAVVDMDFRFASGVSRMNADMLKSAKAGRVGFALAALAQRGELEIKSDSDKAVLEKVIFAHFNEADDSRLRLLPPAVLSAVIKRYLSQNKVRSALNLARIGSTLNHSYSLATLARFYESAHPEFDVVKLSIAPTTLRARAATAGHAPSVAAIAEQFIAVHQKSRAKPARLHSLTWLIASANQGHQEHSFKSKAMLASDQHGVEREKLRDFAAAEGSAENSKHLWTAFAIEAMQPYSALHNPSAVKMALRRAMSANQARAFEMFAFAIAFGLFENEPNPAGSLTILESGHQRGLPGASIAYAEALVDEAFGKPDRQRALKIWNALIATGNHGAINDRAWLICTEEKLDITEAQKMAQAMALEVAYQINSAKPKPLSRVLDTQAACLAAVGDFAQAVVQQRKAAAIILRTPHLILAQPELAAERLRLYTAGKRYIAQAETSIFAKMLQARIKSYEAEKLQDELRATKLIQARFGQAKKSAELIALLDSIELAARGASGQGVESKILMGAPKKMKVFGTDNIQFEPYFVKETRTDAVRLASKNHYCVQANRVWLCSPTGVSTLLLPLDGNSHLLLDMKQVDEKCGKQACKRLTITVIPTFNLSDASDAYLDSTVSKIEILFDAITLIPKQSTIFEYGSLWQYSYQFDKNFQPKKLPTRCGNTEAIAQANSNQRSISSISATGARGNSKKHSESTPVLTVSRKDIEAEGVATVGDLLAALEPKKAFENAEKQTCVFD